MFGKTGSACSNQRKSRPLVRSSGLEMTPLERRNGLRRGRSRAAEPRPRLFPRGAEDELRKTAFERRLKKNRFEAVAAGGRNAFFTQARYNLLFTQLWLPCAECAWYFAPQRLIEAPVRSRQKIRAYAAAAVMLFFAAPLRAQNAPCLRRTVVANVVDEKGNPVPGFTPADFQAKFRGKPVKILSATFDQQPRRIVVLLDTRSSPLESESNGIVGVHEVIRGLISAAAPATSFALATFPRNFRNPAEFSSDGKGLEEQIEIIRTERKRKALGKSEITLWNSILAVVSSFDPPRPGDTIFLVSAGTLGESKKMLQQVLSGLLNAGIRLFVYAPIGNVGSQLSEEQEAALNNIKEFVEATGGNLVRTAEVVFHTQPPAPPLLTIPEEVRLELAGIYAQMNKFYALRLELPEEVKEMREWELKFADEKAARKKHWTLYYQQKIAPCVAAAP